MLPPPEFNSFTLYGFLRERVREKEGEKLQANFFLIKAFKFWCKLTFCSCDQNLLFPPTPPPICSGLDLEVLTAEKASLIPIASVVVLKPINIPLAGTLTLVPLNMLENIGYS